MDKNELELKRQRLLNMELDEQSKKKDNQSTENNNELFFTKKGCDKITNYEQLKQISLSEQQKLQTLGAQLAIKKMKTNDNEQKYNDLIKYLSEKINENDNQEVISVIKRDLKSFISMSGETKIKMNREINLLKESIDDLNEEGDASVNEIAELEDEIQKLKIKHKKEILNYTNNIKILNSYKNICFIMFLIFYIVSIDIIYNSYHLSYTLYISNIMFNNLIFLFTILIGLLSYVSLKIYEYSKYLVVDIILDLFQ
jgi:hypothetical protein